MNRCIFGALLVVVLSAFTVQADQKMMTPLLRPAKLQRELNAKKAQTTFATPELEARWGAADSQPPVIGIFTNDLSWNWAPQPPFDLPHYDKVTQWVEAYYVQWLEAAGIRVVPFPWNATFPEQQALMRQVNGVLFPSGLFDMDNGVPQYYIDKVAAIFEQAKEWNAQGDAFFVWATSMGFQVLAAAAANRNASVQVPCGGLFPAVLPLDPAPAFWNSALYGAASASIVEGLTTQASTVYWNKKCILNSTFDTNPALAATFERLTTHSIPNTNQTFVSSVEGKNGLNVFATQYQPERPQFSFSDPANTHSDASIDASQYLSRVVRRRLMRNTHQFPSRAALEAAVIENFPSTYAMYGETIFYTWRK